MSERERERERERENKREGNSKKYINMKRGEGRLFIYCDIIGAFCLKVVFPI